MAGSILHPFSSKPSHTPTGWQVRVIIAECIQGLQNCEHLADELERSRMNVGLPRGPRLRKIETNTGILRLLPGLTRRYNEVRAKRCAIAKDR